MSELLQQDPIQTFLLAALVIVILAYVIYKRRGKRIVVEDAVEDPYDIHPKSEKLSQQEASVEKEPQLKQQKVPAQKSVQADNTEAVTTTLKPKRSVKKHGKITKENFKEFQGYKILVAEDNIINQKVLKGLLDESGIELVIANDGREALDILNQDDDFLLILMDAHMPRLDGFEASREIRSNPRFDHILIVALSGDTAADDIRKMQEAGMSEHLEKPLQIDALYDIFYAYTEATQEDNLQQDTDAQEGVEVIQSKELDGEKGLEICGGDEAFYHDILNEFVQTYSDSDEKLKNFIKNNALDDADKLLLDIVGVSANIGAFSLNHTAQLIKESLQKIANKQDFILPDQYSVHLTRLLQDIKEYQNT